MKASENQLKYFSTTGRIFSPFQPIKPATIKNLTDRLTSEAIRKPIKLIPATPAEIVQTLYGSGVKLHVKTISKKTGENSYELTYNYEIVPVTEKL